MTAPPFMTLPIRRKPDVIRARHRARQVAALLHFPIQEQACIAAGTFAVACQALERLGRCRLCFAIEAGHLHVFARAAGGQDEPPTPPVSPASPLAVPEGEPLLRLAKPLPESQPLEVADLAWLVRRTEDRPSGLFEEIVKQNQEVLGLLHELYACRKDRPAGAPPQPSAA